MSFSIQNNVAIIDGNQGIYDNKVSDKSIKYGRNAADNYSEYTKSLQGKPLPKDTLDFSKAKEMTNEEFDSKLNNANSTIDADKMPPLKFLYKYLPQGTSAQNLDKMALLGGAFEEMGKKLSVSVTDFTAQLQKAFGNNVSAEALDINNDKQIDVGEYATSMLVADMLSENQDCLDAKNINGEINNDGENKSIAYVNVKNKDVAAGEFKAINNAFGLDSATKEFTQKVQNEA